ncbi:hypothetical protein F8M41_013137 [Gigaspora margarita]|uniref:CCHC-type domain-containing protein n=1 Tax=Gigaspora margarita TaxID=4874 RepID=A0A8H3ZZH1_GIGMA|nr:hypothetical protein F8M41_013137 [Gigaspora margarita]
MIRPNIPIPIYYKIQLNKKKENDDCIVVPDSDDVQVLLLHDMLAPGAAAINSIDQLLQSMNNLILAIGNNTLYQFQESKVVKFSIFSGSDQDLLTWLDEFDKAYVANYVSKVRRSYLSQKDAASEEIRELKKAISEIAQGVKTLIQKPKNKKTINSSTPNLPQHVPSPPWPFQSSIQCFQYREQGHITRECSNQSTYNNNNNNKEVWHNRFAPRQSRNNRSSRITNSVSSPYRPNQPTNNRPNNNNNNNGTAQGKTVGIKLILL